MTEQGLITYLRERIRPSSVPRQTVIGHPAPDTDAVVSALFEAWRRTKVGTPAAPLVQGDLPRETAWLLGSAAALVPTAAAPDPAAELVLTDHNDVAAYLNPVVAVVDHHPVAADTDLNGVEVEIRPVGAATTLVARRLQAAGILPDSFCARVLLGAVLLDTEGLSPHKAKEEDRETAAWLASLCGEDPAALFDTLRAQLLSEEDIPTLFARDYRRYTDRDGRPLLGFAILKVWATAPPDTETVRALLRADLERSGCRVCVAKTVLHHPDGSREERYLAVGEAADTVLDLVAATGGPQISRPAEDEVFLPRDSVHRGRKWYAAQLTEALTEKS